MVDQQTLKNNLLRNVAFDYLYKTHRSDEMSDSFLALYQDLSNHPEHLAEIQGVYDGIKQLQFGQPLPAIQVYAMDDQKMSFPQIAKGKHALFYFWSGRQLGHFKNVSRQVDSLKAKRPDWIFVGVNLATPKNDWKSIIRKTRVDSTHQYRIHDSGEIRHLLHDLNQCIIAKDTIILNGFARLKKIHSLENTEELASQ